MKKALFVFLFFLLQLAAMAALLGVGELAVRLWRRPDIPVLMPSGKTHPPYYWNPRSPQHRINSLGLRGPEITLKKPAGVKRLLLVGDSVVFGAAVADEDTLARQMERALGAESPGRWQVLNAGVTSYDAWDYEGYLNERGYAFEPDVVIVGMFMNDNVPRDAVDTAERRAPKALRQTLDDRVAKSELYQAVKAYLQQHLQGAKHPRWAREKPVSAADRAYLKSFYSGDEASEGALENFLRDYRYSVQSMSSTLPWLMNLPAWEKIAAPLTGMARECRRRKIGLILSIFPLQFEVYPGYRYPEPHATIRRLMRASGAPNLDVQDVFAAGGAGDEYFSKRFDFLHPNARGYAVAKDAFLKMMREQGWLENPQSIK